MKIQYLAVIFIVIILPISMVLSYHIQTQIKTINLQTDYNTKLYNATYDAIRAFKINTVNNRYSTVSDSKMRDIDAAVNTFYNSIATNETLSREDMKQSYIPALVFTLYDGYYIHNKYDNVYSAKDQGKVNIDNATTTYGTKPYIYYSCRYKKGTRDFVVNYTLDNAITIYGNLGSGYETISGYLIDYQDITADNYDSNNLKNWKIEYSGVTITPEILTEHIAYLDADREVNEDDFEYLVYHGKKVYYHITNNKFFWYDNYSITDINDATTNSYASARLWDGHLHSTSSLEYLHSAKKFSEYVTQKIGDITQKNAVTKDGTPITSGVKDDGTQIGFTVDTGKKPIFNPTLDNNDPLITGSIFNENRIAVIRYSITSNLVAAIANYTMYSGNNYAYSLPVLSELDWEKITHEICMISFMQGIPIGHKYYNDYCVVTNNSNEEVINQNNIYIITNNTSTGEREYHLPGCTYLMETVDLKIQNAAYSNLSFIRQTLRIAEGDYHYFYPQMRGTYTKTTKTKIYITGCYHCIVNADETYATDQIIKGEIIGKNNKWKDQVIYDASTNTRLQTIREAYMKALFRERYDLYQANMDAMNVVLEEENTRSQIIIHPMMMVVAIRFLERTVIQLMTML